jgi:hypothetical protein
VAPLGSQPAVVEVEPSDHGANVEGSIDGVKLVVCTGHLCAVGDDGTLDGGAENVPALLELQTLKTAAQGVDEDPSGCVELDVVPISRRLSQKDQRRWHTASSESMDVLWM